MPHVETWQLSPENYPFSYEIETRFRDMDMLGHINNVSMAALLEAGRVRFNSSYDKAWLEKGRRALIASITINYLAESYYPEPMLICCGIARIGNSSWQIAQAAFQQSRQASSDAPPVCVAAGTATLVLTDDNGSLALPDILLEALQERRVSS